VTPYAQGRNHNTPRLSRELHEAYEERTCLFQLHVAVDQIYIPPMAFKQCLVETARYLKLQIPGKGKETYTKNFNQGVLCNEPVMLGLTPAQVRIEKVFTWSQPTTKRGGRVWKHFPVIDTWRGILQLWVIDDVITFEVLHKHLELAGMITGIGVWRPINGGMWGKFTVETLVEKEAAL
jgi:hypothetical protein